MQNGFDFGYVTVGAVVAVEMMVALVLLAYGFRAAFRVEKQQFEVPEELVDASIAIFGLMVVFPVLLVVAVFSKLLHPRQSVFSRVVRYEQPKRLFGKEWSFTAAQNQDWLGRGLHSTRCYRIPLLLNVLCGHIPIAGAGWRTSLPIGE